jgi:hypothetical protein
MKQQLWKVLCALSGLIAGIPGAVSAGDSTFIRVNANARYFVDANDKPFLWLGDTEWELFNKFSVADATTLCANRRSKGFSALQIMVFSVGGPGNANINGQKPFTNDNVATPNDAYFKHVDSIVDAAHQNGLVTVIGIYHQNWGQITLSNARAWAKWMGQRYAAKPNIIWSMYPQATSAFVSIVRELAAGLQEGDTAGHLITMHPDPSPTSSSWINSEPWLSFNTLQTFSSGALNYTMIVSDYNKTPVKPAVNGEARYETESGTTALQIRNGAYWAFLAGGFYSYGHGGNWLSPQTWQSWVNSPGAAQMAVLASTLRSIDWWNLLPDQSLFASGAGTGDQMNAAARSINNEWAIVYLSGQRTVSIAMSKLTAPAGVIAQWIDPKTGAKTIIDTSAATGTHSFSTPSGWEDAVLLLMKKGGITAIGSKESRFMNSRDACRKLVVLRGQTMRQVDNTAITLQGKRLGGRTTTHSGIYEVQ